MIATSGSSPPTLVLFDIDGTLVRTGGAGRRAMAQACVDVFNRPPTSAFPMAGRTDRWIAIELAVRHGFKNDDRVVRQLHQRYLAHLDRELHIDGPGKGILPGVRALLDSLANRDDVSIALLTGNLEAGARAKLEHFGLWRDFASGAFGDDHSERGQLFTVALARAAATSGRSFQAMTTVVVGDTPLDVEVAVSTGARAVGVATGEYDLATLQSSGAHTVLPNFADLGATLAAFRL